eukprot:8078733-Alexandrium_andersonii.AAC.2
MTVNDGCGQEERRKEASWRACRPGRGGATARAAGEDRETNADRFGKELASESLRQGVGQGDGARGGRQGKPKGHRRRRGGGRAPVAQQTNALGIHSVTDPQIN